MTVCIFGCTGYLGSSISSHLSNKGYKIIGVCRKFPKKNKKFKKLFFKVIEGDITDKKFLKKILSLNFSSIIYTISLNHKDSEKNLNKSLEINYLPLLNICSDIVTRKLNIKFLYFSTMQVYGNYSKMNLISEKKNKKNNNVYALTHSMCEDILSNLSYHENFSPISLRLSNGYGFPELSSCDCWWLVINDFCSNAIRNSEIRLNSDGSPLRDFIHISDISIAVEKILNSDKKLPLEMNLASGKTLSMLEIAHLVQKESVKQKNFPSIYIKNKKIEKRELLKRLKVIKGRSCFKISNKQMKNLNIFPKTDIHKGIADTLIKLGK